MKIRYDNEIDAIYFDLKDIPSYDSDEIKDGVIVDYDKEDNIVGIEVLDFKNKVLLGLTIDDLPFPEQDKLTASQYFNFPVTA
ncbi:hypothetical protein GM3708_3618 (plasmid) [Geminocystis sp. NIES-3708]|uniref:DUF2283 domain-containing protein n=1 Tax=Geminocystis sp. NIES-3708 TaxID=1615909 RepID=UPI0005FC93B0|nr:DUF2283 domain-containing protein [Geminocystis sp. NIES-3708]BAQ63212.1 hypothetical protein GM3708_3618 [Geminocystis sp. NIES-3708]